MDGTTAFSTFGRRHGIPGPRNVGLAWLLAASLWAPGTAAGQTSGQITGSVTDVTGGVLGEATLTLRGAADRIARTDADGRFAFRNLPPGDYDLVASRSPFLPARRSLTLAGGDSLTVSFTLAVHLLEQTSVTAGKTGERDMLEIPSSVSVLTGDALQRVEARSVEDLAGRAPAVTVSQNTGFGQLTIRGIGSTTVFTGTDPSSAAYLDGVYLSRPVMLLTDFLDMERVEVMRGPQGTLYGRNAMGGAVNLITRSPTNDFEMGARVVAGDLDTLRAEARVSGPIVKNRLLGSAAIARGYRDGFVRDIDHPEHRLGGEDVTAARAKLQFVISPRSDLLVSADVSHDDAPPLGYSKVLAVKPGFQVSNPPDLHDVRTSTLAEGRNLHYGAAARFTARLTPDIVLTSLTAFRKLDYELKMDADITELELTISHVHEIQHQISEELTVSQQRQGLTWIGGVFLLDDVDRQPTIVTLGGPRLENHLNPEADARSAAAFGQATVDLTQHLSATAGLRYTRERKTFENSGQLLTLDTPVMVLPSSSYAYTDAISNTAWTPKFGLQLHPGRETMAYVSATRGFKSGGFNLTSRQPGLGFAPEWVWSYEGGVKTRVADGRVTLSATAFHTDYHDLQVQTPLRPGVIDISNAAAATIRGVELEGMGRVSRLRAGGHLAWLDAAYDRYIAVGVGGITGDVAGNRLNNAPEWSGRVWLETTFDTGQARAVSLRADSIWQSTVFFSPFNDAVQRQRPYGLLDVSVEFGPKRGPWSIGAFARNLTGADYITGTFGTPPPAFGGRPGDTRRVGIRFTIARQSGRI